VIVDRLEVREARDGLQRSARVRHDRGETRVWIDLPAELAQDDPDLSPLVAATLLPAMRAGENLEVDGPVSPTMLGGAARVRELFGGWAPDLHHSDLRVAEEREPPPRGTAAGSFFSRGVDSTYTAAVPRTYPGPLERLVFVDGLDPNHDENVRAEEIRLAREAAARIGLPMSVVRTNIRELTDPLIMDWEDMVGGALAFVATSLGGGLGHLVVASTDGPGSIGPAGVSPLVEPLLSTGAVRVVHDSVALSRVDKGRWLARERPDLAAGLKVCFGTNRADNCGLCSKCLLTMVTLEAEGALQRSEQFPREIDLDAIRTMRMRGVVGRADWSDAVHALDPERHAQLRAAIVEVFRAPLRPPGAVAHPESPGFRARHSALMVSLLVQRRPWPPLPDADTGGPGLVRAVDPSRRRNLYGVGAIPDGELVGELGALYPVEGDDVSALRMSPEGYLVADGHPPPAHGRIRPLLALRWSLAPLAWRGVDASLAARALTALRRIGSQLGGGPRAPSAAAGPPLGYLKHEPGPGRLPLYSAIDPLSGDQLLSTDATEAVELAFGHPQLIGYMEERAPVTGKLGSGGPDLPFASRFGQRVTGARLGR
jgi:hypothetical protein